MNNLPPIQHLTLVDNLTIVAALLIILYVSQQLGKKAQDMDTYYRANKSLPWSLAVGTIAASWYGGNGTIGTVGYTGTMGLSAFFIWSIGAHLSRFPLALWVAPRISVKVNTTMSELLNRFYGKFASFLGAIVLVIGSLSISEIACAGYVGEAAWGANKFLVAIIVLAISSALACMGGLMGVAVTDMIFFFLMINSVALVFPTAFFSVGGLNGIAAALDPVDPSLMTPLGGTPVGKAIVLILLCVNMYKDPAFYQRFSASNGPKVGKRAMLTCFSIWLTMDICLMMTGIILRALDPAMTVQPEVAYIQLVLSYLPPVARGLFILGMMGAIISTIDSYYLIGGEIVANDIIAVLRKKPLTDRWSINTTRVSCVVFGIIGLVSAFQFPLVYDAVIFLSSLGMSVLFWPVLIAIMYNGKKTNVAGIASMVVGVISWVWFYFKPVSVEALGGQLDPVLIALPLSLVAYLIGNQFGHELARGFDQIPGLGIDLTKLDAKAREEALVKAEAEIKKMVKVEWFGVDGALCLLYAVLAIIIGWGLVTRTDWPVGIMAPAVAALMTTGIFLRYLTEVFTFSKNAGKKKK